MTTVQPTQPSPESGLPLREEQKPLVEVGNIKRVLACLGPGVISGAADDDPSGIATYSIAGAQLGTSLLWTALLTWPLMAVVQMMCARIGMVTGQGLAGALRSKIPKWALVVAALTLLIANTINVGADLAGMADAAEMLSGINSHYFVGLFGIAIGLATILLPYHRIAAILKWLTLTLFAYVITAFAVGSTGGRRFATVCCHRYPRAPSAGRRSSRSWERHQSLPFLLAVIGGGRGREIHGPSKPRQSARERRVESSRTARSTWGWERSSPTSSCSSSSSRPQ